MAAFNGTGAPAAQRVAANENYPWLRSYPADVDWFRTFEPQLLHTFFDRAVARFGDHPATSFLGKVQTYAQIARQVDRATRGLQNLGVKKGDHVGLLLPNCPAFVVYYFAILKAGGTVVNFNPLYTVSELAHQAKDGRVDIMVTLDLKATFPKTKELLDNKTLKTVVVVPFKTMLPGVKSVLFTLLKGKDRAEWQGITGVVPSTKLESAEGAPAAVGVMPDDVAVIQYTGGTTGTPKGAMLTHANLTANVEQIDSWFPGLSLEGQERFLCVIPFFHVFAMTCLLNYAVCKGAVMIMLPRFELEPTLKLIDKEKPTIMAGVPTLFNALAKSPNVGKYDLSTLKFCCSGGAPLPLEVKREFERVSGCKLVEGYGLSETSPVTHINPPNGPIKEGSIGFPVPGTVVSLREVGNPEVEVPMGEKGEICIRGPQVMKGYWNKPKETEEAFVGGFFRTGDVAHYDEDGFAYIVDRIKDLILASGFNVYPRRIEEAIYQHPAVAEVTVIGIPDAYRGEAPKAFIKLRTGQTATEKDIHEFLATRLSKIEMPAEIEFRDELPKTLIGKLSKKELKAEAKAQQTPQAGAA